MNDQKHNGTFQSSGKISRMATQGAIWVTLTSAMAIPLGYFRNWVLGKIGETGEVVGTYATIILFIQVVLTFVLFGGASVVTNFIPKISDKREKTAFVLTYGTLCLASSALFIAAINVFPGIVSFLLHKPVEVITLRTLSALVPLVVISQLFIFCLTGFMEFRLSSLLSQFQLFAICALATISWVFFPTFLEDRAVIALVCAVGAANLSVAIAGYLRLASILSTSKIRYYLPPNFWRFSSFVHLNSITTFAYQSIDQLVLLTAMGTSELGAYFVLLQCAQLIAFVPTRIAQVMLSSFAHLEAEGDSQRLRRAYGRLCRVILLLSTPLALFMTLSSYFVASIFGEWFAERHLYLLFLAIAVQVGILGAVNGMLIMSKEKTGVFFVNSIVLISVQLTVTLALIKEWGAYAVIAGKACGIVVGQIGLYTIIRCRLDELRFNPPREYWISLSVMLPAGAAAYYWQPLPLLVAIAGFVAGVLIFLAAIRFHPNEILAILNRRHSG